MAAKASSSASTIAINSRQFRKHAISYELSDKNKSELYLNLIPVVCSKRVEFLDNHKATEELRRLERRRGRSGKDSLDHPASGSDDLANALAGVVNVALAVASQGWRVLNSSAEVTGSKRESQFEEEGFFWR